MAPWNQQRRGASHHASSSSQDIFNRVQNVTFDRQTAELSPNTGLYVDSRLPDHNAQPQHPKPHKARHSRSMSNPFPSLFSSKKKRSGSAVEPASNTDIQEHEDEMVPRQVADTQRRARPMNGKEFATGSCMTCGSIVRWPKELSVFKCTICVTINDLGPLGSQKIQPSWESRQPASHRRVPPLSVDYSTKIIRQCLHRYLTSKLCKSAPKETDNLSPIPSRPTSSYQLLSTQDSLTTADASQDGQGDGKSPPPDHSSRFIFNEQPTLRPNRLGPGHSNTRSYSSSFSERPSLQGAPWTAPVRQQPWKPVQVVRDGPQWIFRQVEDYLLESFNTFEAVNTSFYSHPPRFSTKPGSEPLRRPPAPNRDSRAPKKPQVPPPVCELDPKLLLLGDVAENGTWWVGEQDDDETPTQGQPQRRDTDSTHVQQKSPLINWEELFAWYKGIVNAAQGWFSIYEELTQLPDFSSPTQMSLEAIEKELLQAQNHIQRILLKATENLLKRPGGLITDPTDLRFLLIIMENPLLHSEFHSFTGLMQSEGKLSKATPVLERPNPTKTGSGPLSGHHSGIIKRIIGLISNAPDDCHNHIVTWLSKAHPNRFSRSKNLIYEFLTYRMIRQGERRNETKVDVTAGLIPELQAGRSGAYLHDEFGAPNQKKKQKQPPKKIQYSDDWQIRAAARVLSLWFAANELQTARHGEESSPNDNKNGQFLPSSDFYNSMIDYIDLVADFEAWEVKRGKFSFCQYPFLLSIWAKTQILEHDARRQMEIKARDAFFDSIMTRRTISQFLSLDVRRECLVDDSLQAVSEIIGSGSEDIKKGLRITFRGEEGIDGGGLRKEWFLLLVREVFNPDHGMFTYDEESQYCYFNPNSFETSDQYFLIGVVMGLAIYNSTILDVALPPFAFRKLLASAPVNSMNQPAYSRKSTRYTLNDLSEYRPRLAHGLKQLLDYEGDVEATFGLDFVIDTEKYGTTTQVLLCPGGEHRAVTNANRREYVDLYVRYILDTSVSRQFEPFKRGFYTVCGGNAFSLFRPEEIELLIRGSDEALDISTLRAVAVYDNWDSKQPDGTEPVVGWFWQIFEEASPKDQRKLLSFITGSDRLPATGASMMPIRISCLGDDSGRFPIARTCFNLISLWKYPSKERLETILWRAVYESEGFGLK